MFLDSDDFISQDHLINLYKSGISEKADIIFGPWRLAGEKMGEGPINYPPRISSEEWLLRWLTDDFVPTCSVDRKSTRLNSSHVAISYAVFCLIKKKLRVTFIY